MSADGNITPFRVPLGVVGRNEETGTIADAHALLEAAVSPGFEREPSAPASGGDDLSVKTLPDRPCPFNPKRADRAFACRTPGRMWNDVVQACPLHPYYMYEAWQQLGWDPRPDLKFYAIPITAAGDAPIAIYTSTPEEKDVPHIDADEIEIIRPEQYKELNALPAETRAWYRSLHARGLFGAFFHLIPHVFTKGPVDLSEAQIIDWNEPPADALVNW